GGVEAVREGGRRIPGGAVPVGAGGERARGGATYGVQRGAARGRGRALHDAGGNGEAVILAGGRTRDLARRRVVRRLWLHQGVPGGEVLPRREDRHDLRGDEQHAAQHDREADIEIGRQGQSLKGAPHAKTDRPLPRGRGDPGYPARGSGERPEKVRGDERSGARG